MACEAGGQHRNRGGEKEGQEAWSGKKRAAKKLVLIEGGKPGAKQRAGLRGLCPAILSNGYLVFQTP